MDGVTISVRHLETVHLRQAHGYKLNTSVGAIMAHKVSGQLRYFHASANNYRLLVSLATVEWLEDLGSLQGLMDGLSWTDHVASLKTRTRPGMQYVSLMWNIRLRVVEMRNYDKRSCPGYKSRLCVFRCLAWLAGRRTACDPSNGALYSFHQGWISREGFKDMEEFPGLTMDELDSVETIFNKGFWVYTQDDNEIRCRST